MLIPVETLTSSAQPLAQNAAQTTALWLYSASLTPENFK